MPSQITKVDKHFYKKHRKAKFHIPNKFMINSLKSVYQEVQRQPDPEI